MTMNTAPQLSMNQEVSIASRIVELQGKLAEAQGVYDGEEAGRLEKQIEALEAQATTESAVGAPSVMKAVEVAKAGGDPGRIEVAQKAADVFYTVETPRETQKQEEAILGNVRTISDISASLKELRKVSYEIHQSYNNDPLWAELRPHLDLVNSLSEKLQNATTTEMTKKLEEELQTARASYEPYKKLAERLNAEYSAKTEKMNAEIEPLVAERREMEIDKTEAEVTAYIQANPSKNTLDQVVAIANRARDGGEYYSGGDQFMSDINVVLSSDLQNDEKLTIIKKLQSQIQSSVIGSDKSDLLSRFKKGLEA